MLSFFFYIIKNETWVLTKRMKLLVILTSNKLPNSYEIDFMLFKCRRYIHKCNIEVSDTIIHNTQKLFKKEIKLETLTSNINTKKCEKLKYFENLL